jgi:carboxyl-terminal processing protease
MEGATGTRRVTIRAAINGDLVRISFPLELADAFLPLIISEQPEVEAIFGAPVIFVDHAPTGGPRWIVEVEPNRAANTLRWHAGSRTLTSIVRDAAGLASTLQLLHSLVTLDVPELSDDITDDLPAAIDRLSIELERGFPGFAIRDLVWAEIRAGFPPAPEMTLEDMERLVARLQDGHTAVRPNVSVYNPPYAVELAHGHAHIRRVPAWSAAAQAGVQPGWLMQLDDIDGSLARTGAPPDAHALVSGRRAIALNGLAERAFTARGPNGETRSWIETARPFSLDELIESTVVAHNAVYVRLHNWIDGVGIEERFDQIIEEHAHRATAEGGRGAAEKRSEPLVLDLRGNTGGNLLLAKRVRRRFLREHTLLGTIRFIRGDGTLAEPVEVWDDPALTGRWPGTLVVLTDSLTYSASEDFLHG